MDVLIPLAFVAALFGAHFYFQSRRPSTPSRTERTFAAIWLTLRRLICFGACVLCVAIAAYIIYGAIIGPVIIMDVAGIAMAISFAGILFHWGMYGTGYKHSDLREDKPVHELRKTAIRLAHVKA